MHVARESLPDFVAMLQIPRAGKLLRFPSVQGNFTLLAKILELALVSRCEHKLFCTVKLKQLGEETLIKTDLF